MTTAEPGAAGGEAADGLAEALARLAAAPELLVCCDYDGTLSPIVADRDRAFPQSGAGAALDRLADLDGVRVAVVSGRSVAVLKRLSGFSDRIAFVGSHGSEFAEGEFAGMGPTQQALLADLTRLAHEITDGVTGADVEEKPISVAVHTRSADRADAKSVMDRVEAEMLSLPNIFVTTGKEVVEVAVLHADKGDAVQTLRAGMGEATDVLFIGDDVTDERAFAKLLPTDVGVKVGTGQSRAGYRVDDPAAVVDLLRRLADLRAADSD